MTKQNTNKLLDLYIMISVLMISCLAFACNSGYYNLNNNDTAKFFKECEDSEGFVALQLKSGNGKSDINEGYVCVCNGNECDPGSICDKVTHECQIKCNGDYYCENSDLNIGYKYKCNENGLVDRSEPDLCGNGTYSCNAENTDCGDCLNDSMGCENDATSHIGKLYSCVDGKKEYSETCKTVSCSKFGECGTCLNGDASCENSQDNIGTLKICSDGHFRTEICENASCNLSLNACGDCVNDSKVCENDDENKGAIKKCTNGKLVETEKCQDNSSPVSCNELRDGCGKCINDTIICEDDENGAGMLKKCIEGKYVIQEYCSEGHSCYLNECGTCRNGKSECTTESSASASSVVRTCEHGKLGDPSACSGGCFQNLVCDSCKADDIICVNESEGSQLFKCIGTGWEQISKCSDGVLCNGSGTECGKCKEGEVVYENDSDQTGQIKTCTNGNYVIQLCSAGASITEIDNVKKCGECKNGDFKCEDDENVGYISKCENGKWGEKSACDNEVSCKNNQCGDCQNGSEKCVDDADGYGKYSQCENGSWPLNPTMCESESGKSVSCNGNICGQCHNTNQKMQCVPNSASLNNSLSIGNGNGTNDASTVSVASFNIQSDYFEICADGKFYKEKCSKLEFENGDNAYCSYNVCRGKNPSNLCIEIDGKAFLFEEVSASGGFNTENDLGKYMFMRVCPGDSCNDANKSCL